MARAFKYTRRGIIGHLEPGERTLLGKLFADVVGMLEPDDDESADPLVAMVGLDPTATVPTDPAVLRLLPSAVDGDDDAALEFRRLTERSLRQGKVGRLKESALLMESASLTLTVDQARALSMALNDVRLVLSTRLGIESDADAEAIHDLQDWSEAEDVESYLALVYNFVSWLQESLMQALHGTLEM